MGTNEVCFILSSSKGCTCEQFLSDSALEGHLLTKLNHVPEDKCQAECIRNPTCYSINYKRQMTEGNCEINDATREMFPVDYKKRKDWIYYVISGTVDDLVNARSVC